MRNRLTIILWIGLGICLFGVAMTADFMKLHHPADKMLHLLLNCLFVIGLVFLLRGYALILAVLAVLGIGVGVEVLQHFVPGRSASLLDMLANGAGIVCGLGIGHLLRRGYRSDEGAV